MTSQSLVSMGSDQGTRRPIRFRSTFKYIGHHPMSLRGRSTTVTRGVPRGLHLLTFTPLSPTRTEGWV